MASHAESSQTLSDQIGCGQRTSKQLKTSQQWWDETLQDDAKLVNWLKNQYHGETKAAARLAAMRDAYKKQMTEQQFTLITIIARQEQDHAEWVGSLLRARGIEPEVLEKKERYWDQTLPEVDSFIKASAVASHAEEMRLERIRVIAADPRTADDIRKVFMRILPQEEFHAFTFRRMTTDEAYQGTTNAHLLGRIALGLEP